ncbi:MAG: RluA family pseudouridine synthase [Simkaniaceae bacterium]|nr:MAG: RluA family pseudouridine synthase [Simkaniaceae bacterium]
MKNFIVEEPKRLDKLLAEHFPDHSRSYFQFLIDAGSVTCNGKKVKKRAIPNTGDEIQIFFLTSPEIKLTPENIPLEILYEDEAIICVNKPPGMVVHPAPGHRAGTFVNALLYHCRSLPPQDLRPGIVHRLDKETSGVLLAAKTVEAHQKLIEAFSDRQIEKEYLAIVVGKPGETVVDQPIGRHRVKRKEMAIIEGGRHAITHIEVLKSSGGFSLVKAKPITGRTHQIRVHLKYLKTPVLGDTVYGPEKLSRKLKIERQLLHAHRLSFPHPIHGKKIEIEAPLPQDFKSFLKNLD